MPVAPVRTAVRIRSVLVRLALGLAALSVGDPAAAQPSTSSIGVPQTWSGRIVKPEGVDPGVAADKFELKIFELTTDHEIGKLVGTLQNGGQGALRDAMFEIKGKGWIRIGKRAATEVGVIRVADLPDGRRRMRMVSDLPLRLYDRNEPVGSDAFPFGFLELIVDSSGTGVGQLVAAASMKWDAEGLLIESAGTPVITIVDVVTDSPPRARAAAN